MSDKPIFDKDDSLTDKWIVLHDHFSKNWETRSKNSWETIRLNTVLCSALISLTIYSIIYIYTSEFFWNTEVLNSTDRILVRLGLISIPITLLFIDWRLHQNFNRQCRRMYKTATVVIKIQERLGLYSERINNGLFDQDKFYVPEEWVEDHKNKFQTGKKFVDHWMKEKDAFYKNMSWLFWIFGGIALILIGFEILLIMYPTIFSTITFILKSVGL